MSPYGALLFLHVLGFVVMLGGTVLARVSKGLMADTRRSGELAAFLQVYGQVPKLMSLGGPVTLLSGFMLAWYAGLGFAQPWMLATYAVLVAQTIGVGAVIGPTMDQATELAKAAVAAGREECPEAHALVTSDRLLVVSLIVDNLNIVTIALMVFKPTTF